jgi:tRNA threonylcarbamoyladenosine biosynthesis protein TsaB
MKERETPRFLAIETSGRVGQVAVAQGLEIRGIRWLDEARRHARDLAPAVSELLAEQGWKPRDLDCVLVSSGPGSYTGLRVGIISAEALAYATGCAVLAIDTFAVIAAQAPADAMQLAVLADAQQENVYVQRFERQAAGAPLQVQSNLAVTTISEFLSHDDRTAWVTGPALHIWASRLPSDIRQVQSEHWDPRVEPLVSLGLCRWQRGERDDLWTLEPLYVRPSAAERKWQESQKG